MRRAAASRVFAIAFAVLLTRNLAAGGGLPDLSGTWKLNTSASDDPQQKLRDAAPAEGSGSDSGDGTSGSGGAGGHRGGGRGGWGGHRHRGGGSGGDGSSWLEARERLVIRHADPELRITDASGRERTLYTDGRKTEEERSQGGTTAVRALWKSGHIEVTSEPEKGPKLVQTYAVSADGTQLTVTTRIEGRRPITISSVYDAVRETPPAAAPPAEPQSDPPGDVEVTRG